MGLVLSVPVAAAWPPAPSRAIGCSSPTATRARPARRLRFGSARGARRLAAGATAFLRPGAPAPPGTLVSHVLHRKDKTWNSSSSDGLPWLVLEGSHMNCNLQVFPKRRIKHVKFQDEWKFLLETPTERCEVFPKKRTQHINFVDHKKFLNTAASKCEDGVSVMSDISPTVGLKQQYSLKFLTMLPPPGLQRNMSRLKAWQRHCTMHGELNGDAGVGSSGCPNKNDKFLQKITASRMYHAALVVLVSLAKVQGIKQALMMLSVRLGISEKQLTFITISIAAVKAIYAIAKESKEIGEVFCYFCNIAKGKDSPCGEQPG
ncbi:unnamed protein product [Urochloa humidicola]